MSETMINTELESILTDALADVTFLTPYEVIKYLNGIMQELGIEKTLPTQMGYNYVRKGYITSEVVDVFGKSKRLVAREDAIAFYVKYLSKNS